jgi:8-oxo-dGTP pyrophosphatase MutT (NUDIX family)
VGVHEKPCGLLDVAGYFGQLNGFVDHMVAEQFLRPEHRQMLTVHSDVDELLREFESYQAPRKRDYPPSKGESIDALAWLLIRDRRLLMVRSKGNQLFYLPGGKREPGESDVAALTREINEELSLNLRPETFTFVRAITAVADGFDDGRQVNMVCYSAEHDGDLVPAAEIDELTWTTTADTNRCPPAGQQVLSYLHSLGEID